MQHLVVPTFVIDPKRRVVIWNRACERLTGVAASEVIGTSRHWQAFYETKRHCLADLVALDLPEQLPELYSEYAARGHNGLGFSAENWCVMPKLGNQLYLAIDAGPIHDEAGQTGDECLRAVATVISRHAWRPLDLATRYGGEEFALIMPELSCDNACAVAEAIRNAVLDLRIVHGVEGAGEHVTLSVGVASHIPGEADDRPDRLLGSADQALYAAKRLGRNRVISAEQMLAEFARLDRGILQVPGSASRKSA